MTICRRERLIYDLAFILGMFSSTLSNNLPDLGPNHPIHISNSHNVYDKNISNVDWMRKRENIDHFHRLYSLKTTGFTKEEYLRMLRNDEFLKEFASRHKNDLRNYSPYRSLEEYFFQRYKNSQEVMDEIHRDPSKIKDNHDKMKEVIKDYSNDALLQFELKKKKNREIEENIMKGLEYNKVLRDKLDLILKEFEAEIK